MKKKKGKDVIRDVSEISSLLLTVATDMFIARGLDCEYIPLVLEKLAKDHRKEWKKQAKDNK